MPNKQSQELRACPFCAAPANTPENIRPGKRPIWEIGCPQYCFSMKRATKKQVIEDWNTRQPDERVAELEAVLSEVFEIAREIRFNSELEVTTYHRRMIDIQAKIKAALEEEA